MNRTWDWLYQFINFNIIVSLFTSQSFQSHIHLVPGGYKTFFALLVSYYLFFIFGKNSTMKRRIHPWVVIAFVTFATLGFIPQILARPEKPFWVLAIIGGLGALVGYIYAFSVRFCTQCAGMRLIDVRFPAPPCWKCGGELPKSF